MNDPDGHRSIVPEEDTGNTDRYYQKDFWSKENLKFSQPHFRLEKSARIINKLAQGKECSLLDVGCGPATLRRLLSPNIQYHGIDIAIHNPVSYLIESDLIKNPIKFGDKQFDIIISQGVFEYMGVYQSQKFAEIARILKENGTFIVSYRNFGHRDKQIYWAHSNIQPLDEFREDLTRHFRIDRFFPAAHNLHHSWPHRRVNQAVNMYFNMNIPIISPVLAVEYFFLCSSRA
jgi:SAM-dependent methyltransferase